MFLRDLGIEEPGQQRNSLRLSLKGHTSETSRGWRCPNYNQCKDTCSCVVLRFSSYVSSRWRSSFVWHREIAVFLPSVLR